MTLKFLKSKPGLALFGASGMIAAAAFAGTTVISKAAPAPAATVTQSTQAEPADAPEAPGAEKPGTPGVDAPGGTNDQSGSQDGPNDQSGVDTAE